MHRKRMSETIESLVSIIVPTRNCSGLLARCLDSIAQFIRWPHEVIVVDYMSTDGTQQVAKSSGGRLIELATQGYEDARSAQRNLGAAAALGEFLLFLDSDMSVKSDVVAECVRRVRSEHAEAVSIPEVSVGERFWARVRQAERLGYRGDSSYTSPAFITRGTFLTIGGFDSLLVSGEDYDFDLRLRAANVKIIGVEQSILHDEANLSFPKYMMKSFKYGRFMKAFARKQPRAMFSRFVPIRPGAISSSVRVRKASIRAEGAGGSYVLLVPFLKVTQMIFVVMGLAAASITEARSKDRFDNA